MYEYIETIVSFLSVQGGFLEIIALSIDPLMTLSALAIEGNVDTWIIVLLVSLTVLKIVLTSFRGTKIICEASLEKAEYIIGMIVAVGIGFLTTFMATTYVAEVAPIETVTSIATMFFAFIASILSLITFVLIRLMIKALEAVTYLFALLPGSFQIAQWIKHGMALFYIVLRTISPDVAAIIGATILFIAIFLFMKTRRLEKFFRRIYIAPVISAIFMRRKEQSQVMATIPTFLRRKFPNMFLCHEAFILKGVNGLPKRQHVYLIIDTSGSYLCRRTLLFWKWSITSFPIERMSAKKRLLFISIFDNDKEIVLRRDLPFDELKRLTNKTVTIK